MTSMIKVNEIQNSAGTTTLAKIENGQLTGALSPATGFRNRIINGDMRIDQRNAGAVVTPASGTYTLDRWSVTLTQPSKFHIQQNAGSVTPPLGFTNYLGVTSLSSYSVLTGDTFIVNQRIEGFNFADMMWGTANAQTITLSFWVRSSLTGTFGGAFTNAGSNRSYPFSFTISAANTWEQKSITVAGDTAGTWVGATNEIGVFVRFGLGSGSTFTSTAGSWQAGNFVQSTGSVSVVGTNGATFFVTGVQLEKGTVATPFEFRSIGQELALCQRYAYVPTQTPSFSLAWVGGALSFQGHSIPHPQPMRATPTVSGVTSFTIQGVTASAAGFSYNASTSYLNLNGNNSNSQGDGTLRSVNGNQIPLISAEL